MTLRTTTGKLQSRRDASLDNQVIQVLIVLLDVDPIIWRRILVPASYSFFDLHVAIQDSMGWLDCHLHQFAFNPGTRQVKYLGIPDDEFEDPPIVPGWTVPIHKYLPHFDRACFSYWYDFGDDWMHSITFEDMFQADEGVKYPVCVSGARKCPPENCGGPHGYKMLLEVLQDKQNPEYAEIVKYIGRYNPNQFSAKSVKFDNPDARWEIVFSEQR